MFNSSLYEIAQDIEDGILDHYNPIVYAVRKTHSEIIQSAIDEWEQSGTTDKGFEQCFEKDFPPGFINRDRNRAKQIIYDLRDIAEGETIRYELEPIYSYVMYHLIVHWCEMLKSYNLLKSNFPEEVIDYLNKQSIKPRSEKYRYIKKWFTDRAEMSDDFGDTYNEDYMHASFAENIATIYLDDEYAQEKLGLLRVEIEEFIDLLPNDLYKRVIKKLKIEKEKKDRGKEMNENGKTIEEEKTVFISYSWEDEEHREWVKCLADRLIYDGINVNIDQYDLTLGDRLPQFMEQQISKATYVLIICTPTYKSKSDERKGGVGYEGHIISGELLTQQNERKFIPIIRKGDIENSIPTCLAGKFGVDLSICSDYEKNYKKLVDTLKGIKTKPAKT